ncbi:glycosyltransferase [Microvirga sp. 2TAF3]|uniref:glycosyltransferase n=1 Tax=Microvirga sp. 2TAF3 TaxID=3233014 RepID=UPI003F9CED3A
MEIGFLADHGHSPDLLHHAAIFAEAAGVTADVLLLKGGLVEETEFYRALAHELGLPFTLSPRLSRQCRYPDSILTGIAPMEPVRTFAIAPCGPVLSRLLKDRRVIHKGLVVTPPSRLTKAVIDARSMSIAHRGANALSEKAPDLSIRGGFSVGQIAGLSILSLLLSFGSIRTPDVALAFLGTGLSLLFLGGVVLRLAAAILDNPVQPPLKPPRTDDAALPIYTIIAPLYRERRVASRLVAALSHLDYPAAKLDIKFVLEADDLETQSALAAIDMPGFIEVIVAPSGDPRTKPRALNIALPLARGRYTVIYDAEDVPDPGQLRDAVAAFIQRPPEVACLQARLTIDNTDDTWLTRLFTIEYATLFDVFNPGLAEIGSPMTLGGTSNHFRTKVLHDICGWDAWNVTEDADLGIRLARFGYRIADLPSSTLEEAPSTLDQWMNQRTRWMKGFIQTCVSHSRKPWVTLVQLGPWRFFGALVLTFGTVLSALSYPFFTGLFVVLWRQDLFPEAQWQAAWRMGSLTLFLLGVAAIFLPACVALNRRRLWRLLPWIPLLPAYYALVSIAAWRALWEVVREPFHWNKTSHGLARTSRSGLLQKHQARADETTSVKTAAP